MVTRATDEMLSILIARKCGAGRKKNHSTNRRRSQIARKRAAKAAYAQMQADKQRRERQARVRLYWLGLADDLGWSSI